MTPIPPQIAAIERPSPALMTYYWLRIAASLFAAPIMLPLLYFRYHTMRYKFDEEGIHMRWGILFRNEIVLNYARIQDIHLKSNFVERWLGLARIEIQTASGSATSEMVLEGLADNEGMRDFLYSRMRGARDKDAEHPKAHSVTEPDALAGTLREIAVELRAIRELMEKRSV